MAQNSRSDLVLGGFLFCQVDFVNCRPIFEFYQPICKGVKLFCRIARVVRLPVRHFAIRLHVCVYFAFCGVGRVLSLSYRLRATRCDFGGFWRRCQISPLRVIISCIFLVFVQNNTCNNLDYVLK